MVTIALRLVVYLDVVYSHMVNEQMVYYLWHSLMVLFFICLWLWFILQLFSSYSITSYWFIRVWRRWWCESIEVSTLFLFNNMNVLLARKTLFLISSKFPNYAVTWRSDVADIIACMESYPEITVRDLFPNERIRVKW